MPTRVRLTFSNMSPALITCRSHGINGAVWVNTPPASLYPVGANIPHNSPLNTVAGRSAMADINPGGSVIMTYNVGAGGTSTITIPAPAAPGAAPAVNVVNTGMVQATSQVSGNPNQWDIAINFR